MRMSPPVCGLKLPRKMCNAHRRNYSMQDKSEVLEKNLHQCHFDHRYSIRTSWPTSSFTNEERGVYRVLVVKPEGKRPMGRPRRRWVDNIRMDLQEVGCGHVDWIGLAQDRDRWRTLVSAVMNLRVP